MSRSVNVCWAGLAVVLLASAPLDGRQAGAPRTPPPAANPAAGQGRGRGAAAVKSLEIGADGKVTFRLRAPNAKEVVVSVAGKRLSMQKDDQGVWSVTTDPLTPDIYTYSLIVDG